MILCPQMMRSASNAAWTPASLFSSGEVGAFYDPSDLSTLGAAASGPSSVSVGDTIRYCGDKSGNDLHATSSNNPILKQDANGNYCLECGSSRTLSSDTVTQFDYAANVHVMICVQQVVAPIMNQGCIDVGSLNPVPYAHRALGYASNTQYKTDIYDSDVTTNFSGYGLISATAAPFIMEGFFDGENNYINSALNGGALASTANSSWDATDSFIEIGVGLTNKGATFNFYGAVVIDRGLTTFERAALASWLAAKASFSI